MDLNISADPYQSISIWVWVWIYSAYFPFLKHVFTDDIPPKHAGVEPQCDFKSDYHGSNAAKCLVFDLRTSDFIVRLEPNKRPWKGSQNKK